jgi:hypothetical protein
VKDLVAEGKIASRVFITAFQEWAQTNFGDMMARQSKTAAGAFSTLKDNINAALRTAFKPTYNTATDLMNVLADLSGSQGFQNWAERAGEASNTFLTSVENLVRDVADLDVEPPETTGFQAAGGKAGGNFTRALEANIRGTAQDQEGEGSMGWELGWKIGGAVVKGFDAATKQRPSVAGGGPGGRGAQPTSLDAWLEATIPGAAQVNDAMAAFEKRLEQGMGKITWGDVARGGLGAFKRVWQQETPGYVDNMAGFLGWHFQRELRGAFGFFKPVLDPLNEHFKKAAGVTQQQTKRMATSAERNTGIMRASMVKNASQAQSGTQRSMSQASQSVSRSTEGMKSSVTKNTGIMRASMVRNNTGMQTDTSKKFGSIQSTIAQKSNQSKTVLTGNWNQMRVSKGASEDQMKSKSSSIWSSISNLIGNAADAAYDRVAQTWNNMLNFVADVLSRLGFKDQAGQVRTGVMPTGTSKDPRAGASGSPTRPMARGGIIPHPAGLGTIADGRHPHAVFGEAGPEAYVPLGRRTREGMHALYVAARTYGFQLMQMAQGGILDAWKKGGTRFFQAGGFYPTTRNWDPDVFRIVRDVEGKFPTRANTYPSHPGGEVRSHDYWALAGRGSAIAQSTGEAIKNYMLKSWGFDKGLSWLIWNGLYHSPQGTVPSQYGAHRDHLHATHGAKGFGAGGISVKNPMQALFERLWRPVQSYADSQVAKLQGAPYILSWAAGGLTDRAVSAIRTSIDSRIPDTITMARGHRGGTEQVSGSLDQWLRQGLSYGKAFPPTDANVATLHSLAMEESTGNPKAINDLPGTTDDPSGLLQVKPSTFVRYRVKASDNILHPVHNTAASTRYQKARYGELQAHAPYAKGGIWRPHRMASGGILGVSGGRLGSVGRYNPPVHKGVDVFASPGSRVSAPVPLEVVNSFASPNLGGQGGGWATVGGKCYGFVAAHFASAPRKGRYTAGQQMGTVGNIPGITPHIHWAAATGHIPPPGTLSPLVAFGKGAPAGSVHDPNSPTGGGRMGSTGGISAGGGSGGGFARTSSTLAQGGQGGGRASTSRLHVAGGGGGG